MADPLRRSSVRLSFSSLAHVPCSLVYCEMEGQVRPGRVGCALSLNPNPAWLSSGFFLLAVGGACLKGLGLDVWTSDQPDKPPHHGDSLTKITVSGSLCGGEPPRILNLV